MKITTEDIKYMVKEVLNEVLLKEDKESKNLLKARRYLEMQGYSTPDKRQQVLDNIRTDIPNSRMNDCKFILGVTRLFCTGQLQSQRDIADLNLFLKYINSDAHVNEYDNNLNNLSLSELKSKFKSVADDDLEMSKQQSANRTYNINNQYSIVPINDFEQSSKYGKYTSWCVTHDANMLKSYTADGAGRFYFCLRKGFETEPKVEGQNSPLDCYGLSMIAVSVNMDGSCNTITCRWNHDMGGNDSVMNVEQLEQLLGRNFYNTFKPYSKEELKAKGKYISEVIGTYYNNGGLEGIVCAVDKDEKPTLIMSLNINNTKMTWQEAMRWAKKQPSPWHLPTKEELEKIWITKGYPNQITKMLNRGLKKYGKELEDWFYWSSSECSESGAWFVYTGNGGVCYYGKDNGYFSFLVAPVGSVSAF